MIQLLTSPKSLLETNFCQKSCLQNDGDACKRCFRMDRRGVVPLEPLKGKPSELDWIHHIVSKWNCIIFMYFSGVCRRESNP